MIEIAWYESMEDFWMIQNYEYYLEEEARRLDRDCKEGD